MRSAVGGKRSTGRAQLETSELVFRGDFRAVVPLEGVTSLSVKFDTLMVKFLLGTLELDLGADAAAWPSASATRRRSWRSSA